MIKIIDGYGFDYDRQNYVLIECGERDKIDKKTRKPTGEKGYYEDIIGYFSTIEAMLNRLLDIAAKKSADNARIQNIGDYLAIMAHIADDIKSAIDNVAF